MKSFKLALLAIITLSFSLMIACNEDGEKLTGKVQITVKTEGTVDAGQIFLVTFSDLVGIQDYPDGVQFDPNETKTLDFPRVGEKLSIYLSNIPANCPGVSSSSSTISQIGFNDSPMDPDHPEAEYESIYIVPVDGSTGELTFTVTCN